MKAICQRCRESCASWRVKEAQISVGELSFWKVQLCELCTVQAQMIIHAALEPPRSDAAVDPQVARQREPATRDKD